MSQLIGNETVSVKLIGGEEAELITELMQSKIADLLVEDYQSYLSLMVEGKDLVFDMSEIAEEMGSPYSVGQFLAILTSYKGDIEVADDAVIVRVFSPQTN